MIYIIKKLSNFKLNVFETENKATGLEITKHAELTEAQYNSIVDQYYNIGTVEEPILIDLKLVTGVDFETMEGKLFDQVTELTFKNRDEAIQAYKDEQKDALFHNKKYKIIVDDFKRYNTTVYRAYIELCKIDPDIDVVSEKDEATRLIKGSIFLDVIEGEDNDPPLEGTDMYNIQNAVYPNTEEKIFELIPNPIRNDITVIIAEDE